MEGKKKVLLMTNASNVCSSTGSSSPGGVLLLLLLEPGCMYLTTPQLILYNTLADTFSLFPLIFYDYIDISGPDVLTVHPPVNIYKQSITIIILRRGVEYDGSRTPTTTTTGFDRTRLSFFFFFKSKKEGEGGRLH